MAAHSKHLAAYSGSLWKPKHHYSMHLPMQLRQHGVLQSCFVLERKHRIVKRFAHNTTNIQHFDRACLDFVTWHGLGELGKEPPAGIRLVDPRPATAAAAEAARMAQLVYMALQGAKAKGEPPSVWQSSTVSVHGARVDMCI